MVNMLQAGLLDKGLFPNDMQRVLLEERLASSKLRACVSARVCVCACVHARVSVR